MTIYIETSLHDLLEKKLPKEAPVKTPKKKVQDEQLSDEDRFIKAILKDPDYVKVKDSIKAILECKRLSKKMLRQALENKNHLAHTRVTAAMVLFLGLGVNTLTYVAPDKKSSFTISTTSWKETDESFGKDQ